MGALILLPLVFILLTVFFIGTVAVAPRTYPTGKRILSGCLVVTVIVVLVVLFCLALIYRV